MKNAKMFLPPLIALFCVASTRSDPEEFTAWRGVVSHIAETELPWQELQADGDHRIAVSHRSENGPAELHESQREIVVVQGGEGTLLVGGAILEPEAVKPNEIRGSSIAGGIETQMRQGDIVQIEANVPHQVKIARGKYLIYTTVRIGPA